MIPIKEELFGSSISNNYLFQLRPILYKYSSLQVTIHNTICRGIWWQVFLSNTNNFQTDLFNPLMVLKFEYLIWYLFINGCLTCFLVVSSPINMMFSKTCSVSSQY